MKFSPETVSRSPIFRPREHALLHIALHGHEGRIFHGNPPMTGSRNALSNLPCRCVACDPTTRYYQRVSQEFRSSYWGWESQTIASLEERNLKDHFAGLQKDLERDFFTMIGFEQL